jgi:hypothetical protein
LGIVPGTDRSRRTRRDPTRVSKGIREKLHSRSGRVFHTRVHGAVAAFASF